MSDVTPLPVRTVEEPMAFTSAEVWRGGRLAWLIFVGLLLAETVAYLVLLDISLASSGSTPWLLNGAWLILPVMLVGGTVSAAVMALGVGLALPIAHALRRTPSIPVHLATYTLLGVVVGTGYLAVLRRGQLFAPLQAYDTLAIAPAAAAALAIPLAWWWTARRALRIDAGLMTPRRRQMIDVDAAEEDRADENDRPDGASIR